MGNMNPLIQTQFRRALLAIGAAFCLGGSFNYLFYHKWLGINAPLFVILLLAVFIFVAAIAQKKVPAGAWMLMVPMLVCAAFISVRASESLTFFNLIVVLFGAALLADWTHEGIIATKLRDWIVPLFGLPFVFLGKIPSAFSALFSVRTTETHQKARAVARGIFMALPVLAVFAILFASADLVFQKILKNIFSIEISADVIAQTIIIAVMTFFFTGALQYIFFSEKKVETTHGASQSLQRIGQREMVVFFSLVNALVLAFIIIQITYLFGGEKMISGQGLTYAEYARKGFFELIVAALLSLGIVFAAERSAVRFEGKTGKGFRVFATMLLLEVVVVLASAGKRLSLYEGAYGFTDARFYAHVIIWWLAIVFVMVGYYLWRGKEEAFLIQSVSMVSVVTLMTVNLVNPHVFIAQKNIDRYLAGSSAPLDVFYLNRLSDDAIPLTVQFLKNTPEWKDEHKELARELYWDWQARRESSYGPSWQSSHLARARAGEALDSIAGRLEAYKDFIPDSVKTDLINAGVELDGSPPLQPLR